MGNSLLSLRVCEYVTVAVCLAPWSRKAANRLSTSYWRSTQLTGEALNEFVRIRGIGPFRLAWKRAGGQYFSKGPGSIDLTTDIRTADLGDRIRYAAMSTGSYTMDGLLVGSAGGSIYAYSHGGLGSVFDALIGNPEPMGD